MQKTAQERGVLNKLREWSNISGRAAESFFSPQLKEVMDQLREVDDNVRSIVSGKSVDGGDPGPSQDSMKKMLQSAKTNLNRREFMKAVTDLGSFHKSLAEVVSQLAKLDGKVNEVHHQFLFPDDESHEGLRGLRERMASEQSALLKEASIGDFLHNLVNERGRAMAFYEKRYPKQVGKMKKDLTVLLAKSEALLGQTVGLLKEMASARATRNVDRYMSAAEKVKKNYESYHKQFQTFYTDNVKQFEKIFMKAKEEAPSSEVPTDKAPGAEEEIPFDLTREKGPDTEQSPQTRVVIPSSPGSAPPSPVGPTIPAQPLAPHGPEAAGSEPFGMAPSFSPGVLIPPKMPTNIGPYSMPGAWQRDTTPAPAPEGMSERPPTSERATLPPMLAHKQFVTMLESLSGESPLVLAAVIRKYARSIQTSDPKVSAQLFKVASRIGS